VLRQSVIASRLALASLPLRLGSSLVIIIGMACVVGVLITMLSVTAGMLRLFRASGDPSHAIVLSARSLDEHGVELDQAAVDAILDAPGIARAEDGGPMADAEALVSVPPAAGFVQGSLNIRGIGSRGMSLRPEVRIIAGHLFQVGRHELIAGAAAARAFDMKVGDTVIMPDGEWPIVGTFAGGGVLESQLVTDAQTLMAATRKGGFGSVVVKLVDPATFEPFRQWLTSNPALDVTAQRQADYYISKGWDFAFYETMAYFVAALMSVGALFGAVNILYSAVRARTRELAVLRALGYEPLPLSVSVTIESVFLSLAGALAGAFLSWALFNGHESMSGYVFRWSISPRLVALGIAWSLALALLGSLFPAIRAARLPVSKGLYE
jgi:putative ABC transport system permease protein